MLRVEGATRLTDQRADLKDTSRDGSPRGVKRQSSYSATIVNRMRPSSRRGRLRQQGNSAGRESATRRHVPLFGVDMKRFNGQRWRQPHFDLVPFGIVHGIAG